MLHLLTCHGVVVSDGTLTQYPSNWVSKSVFVSPATWHPAPSLQAGSGLRQVISGHQMMAQMVIRSTLFNLFLTWTSRGRLEAHRNVIWRHFGFLNLTCQNERWLQSPTLGKFSAASSTKTPKSTCLFWCILCLCWHSDPCHAAFPCRRLMSMEYHLGAWWRWVLAPTLTD